MSKFKLSKRSYAHLCGVHPDLCAVVKRAIEITEVDFGITEGIRTYKRQAQLVKTGVSKTYRSRHLTGHAVDVVAWIGGRISWHWPLYKKIFKAFSQAADELNVSLEWGGNWYKFRDGPHFQLSRRKYPDWDKGNNSKLKVA